MSPEKLAKIKAMAEDERCEPRMREVAQAMLRKYAPPPPPPPAFEDEVPEPPPPRPRSSSYYNQPHPGMQPTPEYVRQRFMDLGQWGRTKNGNLIHTSAIKGKTYKTILFAFKKTPMFGWMRIDPDDENPIFGETRHPTMSEAHQAAWESLMRL